MKRRRIARSCADHLCGCVYCSCQRFIEQAIGFRCPQQYACFGSDVMRNGYRLPPADLSPGIIIDEALFDDRVGRFSDCVVAVPDSKA